ncbi:hypothetical protein EYZ11_008302 [Aspergillus tanneri]|uniref:Uncharacterized protein n=1 Tax=Aspergillus tanneri TaxID=1220188 RepID=A0A4S3JGC5_9EURO|nr:hypothetical protein EYZ11_008302 [Aspergillus tanneri]
MQLNLKLLKGYPGSLHEYAKGLVAFEYTKGARRKPNTLLFLGGLGDGLCTVEYIADLVSAAESTQWSIFSPILSSSYGGWGLSHLGKDIDEIAQCVRYIREYKTQIYGSGKIVVMGHSTGSQDVMHYLTCVNPRPKHPVLDRGTEPVTRPCIDGAIIQAPVSDREAMLWVMTTGTDRDSPETMRELCARAAENAKKSPFEDGDTLDTLVPLSVTSRIGYPNIHRTRARTTYLVRI